MSVSTYTRSMTEESMRLAITEAVERLGGRVFYVHDSRYAPAMADMPYLIILLPSKGRVVFCELKSGRRVVTDGQRAVLDLLDECPAVGACVVRSEAKDVHDVPYDRFMAWLADGM